MNRCFFLQPMMSVLAHFFSSPEMLFIKKQKKVWLLTTFLSALTVVASQLWVAHPNALATSWTQTNWNGGTASGTVATTVTTYSAATSIETGTAGQITLGQVSDWWNAGWDYRKTIQFDNSSSTQTNYQMPVAIRTDNLVSGGKATATCSDFRFVTTSGTELPYWIDPDSPCNTTNTIFWVKVNSIPSGSSTIYAYYGNAEATAVADGDGTFEFFDDFTGDALDTAKWTVNATGSITGVVSGGNYRITTAAAGWLYGLGAASSQHQMKYGAVNNVAVEWRQGSNSNSAGTMGQVEMAFVNSSNAMQAFAGFEDGQPGYFYCLPSSITTNGFTAGSSACPNNSRMRMQLNDTSVKVYLNDTLFNTGSASDIAKISMVATTYPGAAFFDDAHLEWIFTRKQAATPPTIAAYGDEENQLATSGTLTSNIFDAELPSNWSTLSYTTSGGTTEVRVRTGSLANMSDAVSFASCDAVTSGADISTNNCVDDGDQYVQYQVTLAFSSGGPTFQDITLLYQPSDSSPPATNATTIAIADFVSGNWLNAAPTITWTAATDNEGGSDILGYCIALDAVPFATEVSNGLNPEDDAGVLQDLDDGQSFSPGTCQYIVTGTSLNLGSVTGLTLTSGKRYFFSIMAIDRAGNVWSGTTDTYRDLIQFKFDNTLPTPPSYVSVPGSFVSSKAVTVTWPSTGPQTAADADSGLAGLQYRIGSSGTWYGVSRTGAQNLTDLLTNSGTYTMDQTVDYPLLNEGSNVFYLRALDNAGNPSAQYATGAIKINTISPTEVENLSVTPTNGTTNSFAFDWDPPSDFTGDTTTMTYCYTINTLPTANTCTFTSAGVSALTAGAYATQPGTNNFYVVAKDETGNINYLAYDSIAFTYSGSAPGVPLNVDVTDISTKANSSWKLAISWAPPTSLGAGVANYKVFRSTTATACSDSMTAFTEIGQVGGSATVYSDSGLTQQTYYYCVKACDSANNCGAVSSTDSGYPDGKYTEAASLTSGPTANGITSRQGTISWSTNRNSDSRIQYGTKSGEYFTEEVGNSDQVTDHTVKLDNLFAGTTYYYKAKWIDEDGNVGQSVEKTFSTNPPPVITDPKPKSIGLETVVLQFTAKGATKVKVYYGKNTSFGNVAEVQTSTNESSYTVQLEGLEDGTKYYYKINPVNEDTIEYETSILTFDTIARPKISQIEVQQVPNTSQSTLLISWYTNTETSSNVTYYPSDNPTESRDELKAVYRLGEHKTVLTGLRPQTSYTLVIKGRDKLGNEAVSSPQLVTTATDSRPPTLTDIQIETSSLAPQNGSNGDNLSQLIITWTTDELSTSQVEYGEGISGQYSQKSTKDANLTYNHTVVINSLPTSKVFHLRALSTDVANNTGTSSDLVAITNKPSDQALDLVVQNLGDVFGFLQTGTNE